MKNASLALAGIANITDADQGLGQAQRLKANCSCATPRRGFLGGLLALGAGAVLPGCTSPGASSGAVALRERIDTHHHLFSPAYLAELAKVNQAPPIVRNWSVARTMDDMDKAGVATSILSVTTPQVGFVDAANAARIARESVTTQPP